MKGLLALHSSTSNHTYEGLPGLHSDGFEVGFEVGWRPCRPSFLGFDSMWMKALQAFIWFDSTNGKHRWSLCFIMLWPRMWSSYLCWICWAWQKESLKLSFFGPADLHGNQLKWSPQISENAVSAWPSDWAWQKNFSSSLAQSDMPAEVTYLNTNISCSWIDWRTLILQSEYTEVMARSIAGKLKEEPTRIGLTIVESLINKGQRTEYAMIEPQLKWLELQHNWISFSWYLFDQLQTNDSNLHPTLIEEGKTNIQAYSI